jgi:hypothetical protein
LRTARRAASTTTRCDAASAGSSSNANAPSSSVARLLAPSPRQNLVATVAAKSPPAPPPPPPPSGFTAFARANWPVFVVFETVALIGAAVSGVSSRRKRLEIQDLNGKLREMMTKVEQSKVCEFVWPEPSADDDDDDDDASPGSALLTKASKLLELGELDAAIATFDEAKLAISGAFGADTSSARMDDKGAFSSLAPVPARPRRRGARRSSRTFFARRSFVSLRRAGPSVSTPDAPLRERFSERLTFARSDRSFSTPTPAASAAWLGAGKGTAVALVRKGDVASLTRAVSELKAVCGAAEREGDGTVYGLLGDVLADLGQFAEAGEWYDRCLAMD